MAVGLSDEPELAPVNGIRVGTAAAGIGKRERDDLTVLEIAPGSHCAATFTRNQFCAAPVIVARRHLGTASPRYLLVNAGNANAGTGERGLHDAERCCALVAGLGRCDAAQVLPFSTGVIGEPLPVARFEQALPGLMEGLDAGNWPRAARAIMTTDTVPKGISLRVEHEGETATVTGIVKGSGMLRPDMATMLAFIATDAAAGSGTLQAMLADAVRRSFNRITVDGDTSTNDACVLVATGHSKLDAGRDAGSHDALAGAVHEVCRWLAQSLVRDAEGATKFIRIDVGGGASEAECLQVGFTIAHSPLVKTAFFASDPNWGRILAAVGRAGVTDLDVGRVGIHLGDVCIVEDGARSPGYTEAAGQAVMDRPEIDIRVSLGRGDAAAAVWTSDLSHDYVRINAEYRS